MRSIVMCTKFGVNVGWLKVLKLLSESVLRVLNILIKDKAAVLPLI